jgi:hypothetical protein
MGVPTQKGRDSSCLHQVRLAVVRTLVTVYPAIRPGFTSVIRISNLPPNQAAILFAGALLGDREMLSIGDDYPSLRNLDGTYLAHVGEDCQTFYVAQTSATEINCGFGGYGSQHLGMPEFGFSHVHYTVNDVVGCTTNSYRLCCTVNAWIGAVLCARMMGLVDEWNHPALFDYTDRYVTSETSGWTRSWSTGCGDMWDQYRSQF